MASHPSDPYRVLVTGSREWRNRVVMRHALTYAAGDRPAASLQLIEGGAGGADQVSAQVAVTVLHWPRPRVIPADWPAPCPPECPPGHRKRNARGEYCPEAGHRRNSLMVAAAAEIPGQGQGLAFFAAGALNRGTLDCSTKAILAGLPTTCWCDRCDPEPLPHPCMKHSLRSVLSEWDRRLAALAPSTGHLW